MKKRLVCKLVVMLATLGAMTLLQGCGEDEGGVRIGFAWMPVIPGVTFGTTGGLVPTLTAGGTSAVAAGSGGQTSSGAVQ